MHSMSIIGLGVVGQSLVASALDGQSIDLYDKDNPNYQTFDNLSRISTDVVFVCVNTPMLETGEQDTRALDEVLDTLTTQGYKGVVIIKSTVLYITIEKYSSLKIVMNPEFLNARTAVDDFQSTRYIVLGGDTMDSRVAANVLSHNFIYSFSTYEMDIEYCTIKEAIAFKYARNIKLAMNTLYWEMIHDITGDSSKISGMMKNLPAPENSQVSKDGYRGYGQSLDRNLTTFSACLDKDINAVKSVTNHPFLESIVGFNNQLLKT